jgi:hypothetical protein
MLVIQAMWEVEMGDCSLRLTMIEKKHKTPFEEYLKQKTAGGMVQEAEYLPRECKVLSS